MTTKPPPTTLPTQPQPHQPSPADAAPGAERRATGSVQHAEGQKQKRRKKKAKGKPNEGDWANAKRLCKLNQRQIEMAKTLGMNPRKLPGLRPSPSQRWKLPVGEFIEQCFAKRFGEPMASEEPWASDPRQPAPPDDAALVLIQYLINLHDDLSATLAGHRVGTKLLRDIAAELREVAAALDAGQSPPGFSSIEGFVRRGWDEEGPDAQDWDPDEPVLDSDEPRSDAPPAKWSDEDIPF